MFLLFSEGPNDGGENGQGNEALFLLLQTAHVKIEEPSEGNDTGLCDAKANVPRTMTDFTIMLPRLSGRVTETVMHRVVGTCSVQGGDHHGTIGSTCPAHCLRTCVLDTAYSLGSRTWSQEFCAS